MPTFEQDLKGFWDDTIGFFITKWRFVRTGDLSFGKKLYSTLVTMAGARTLAISDLKLEQLTYDEVESIYNVCWLALQRSDLPKLTNTAINPEAVCRICYYLYHYLNLNEPTVIVTIDAVYKV